MLHILDQSYIPAQPVYVVSRSGAPSGHMTRSSYLPGSALGQSTQPPHSYPGQSTQPPHSYGLQASAPALIPQCKFANKRKRCGMGINRGTCFPI